VVGVYPTNVQSRSPTARSSSRPTCSTPVQRPAPQHRHLGLTRGSAAQTKAIEADRRAAQARPGAVPSLAAFAQSPRTWTGTRDQLTRGEKLSEITKQPQYQPARGRAAGRDPVRRHDRQAWTTCRRPGSATFESAVLPLLATERPDIPQELGETKTLTEELTRPSPKPRYVPPELPGLATDGIVASSMDSWARDGLVHITCSN